MNLRTFDEQVLLRVLASNASATYTQSFSTVLNANERVVYVLIAHASANHAFNVTIATDASGTSPTDLFTAVTANSAGSAYTLEIGPGALTTAKQFVSPKVTVTAGTYTLLEIRTSLRNQGNLTQHSSYASAGVLLT